MVGQNLFDITGKKAIVTGGGQGLGFAMVETLCNAGATVRILDINKDIQSIARILPGDVQGFICDLLDREKRTTCFEIAVDSLGGSLDILINNAGTTYRGSILDFPQASWDMVMELNLNAVFSMCQIAGQYMVKQKSGKILNVASMNSFFGGTYTPAYASSKGGVAQFTKALSNELAQYGINANAIAPGFFETDLTKDIREKKEIYASKLSRIPMGRWGRPEDLQGIVLFLCSAASDYISGAVIPIDGGYLCK
jgi:2-deoxy-D-gluconate 3-dehydrogenase